MVNFVGVQSESKETKLRNLLIIGALIGFISILFHFTVVFFFGLILKSVFLVGVFLAVSNIVSLLFDIPIGVLQKYIRPKTFILISGIMMVLAILVFFKFVYIDGITGLPGADGKAIDWGGMFFNSFFNLALLLLAASFYGLISETFGVTSFSYILDNTTPSEYGKYLSKFNIYSGAGSMFGLILSGLLLALNIKLALIIFLFLVFLFLIFVGKYFDNGKDTISIDNLRKIKLDSFKQDIGKNKNKITQNISTKNLMLLAKETTVIFLKPLEIKGKIDFKEIYDFTKLNFSIFIKIIFQTPRNLMMFWVFFILMQFSFWDTFVSTFLIDFLENLTHADSDNPLLASGFVTGYVLLGLIAIPGFVLQDPFINLSKKLGEFNILMFGTILSGLSLFLFGFFSDNVTMILILGLINSVGYAAVIGIGQGLFSEKYNILYAVRNNLKQIDSTVSAAPLKIVLNLANVVGLFFGSMIVSLMGYGGFFFAFGGLLIGLFFYSVINYKKINESGKEGEDMFFNGNDKNNELEEFDGEVFK